MGSLVPFYITAFDKGLINNKKPFLIPDEAFAVLENAFVFRERVTKREGIELLGRLARNLTAQALGVTDGAGTFSGNIRTILSLEANSDFKPRTISITVGAQVFTDPGGTGILTGGGGGTINYVTMAVTLQTAPVLAATAVTAAFTYFPSLPVMGISKRELPAINDEQTVWFDTKYAYIRSGTDFVQFIPGTTWNGSDSDFFWTTNYRGAGPENKLFFVTNFFNNAGSPMRYTDGTTWTDFAPLITATETLWQARIIIPYYSRLLMMNVWEGTTAAGRAGAVNIQNRMRFSGPASGSPVAADAFRTDIFGRGGVIDAPTSEAIIGCLFVKNTLIVLFEQTTWQLTYVGEYGLPFVWERVSADFGSESTFSSVLYENQMLAVGDKAIIAANAVGAQRIDLDIPNQIFNFKNTNDGVKRVWGIRDYQKEVIYWNYPDPNSVAGVQPIVQQKFPNKVLLYNYRNSTWAIFRDNITAFGIYQLNDSDAITWDSTTVNWDDPAITWEDPQTDALFPAVVIGNQQGYVHTYGYTLPDDPSLAIDGINLGVSPIVITSINHNLETGEIIRITGMQFVNSVTFASLATDLNGQLYRVQLLTPDTFSISKWNFVTQEYENNFSFTPASAGTLYIGGGEMALYPQLNVQSKDINVFQDKGFNVKMSYIDFLMQSWRGSAFSVVIAMNTTVGLKPAVVGNLLTGNTNVSTSGDQPYYTPASDYAWFRFFATVNGQFFRIIMTYNDDLMNTQSTHSNPWTLYAITAYVRPGGKVQFP